jgi:hypothetical protein
MGLAIHNFAGANNSALPPYAGSFNGSPGVHSLFYYILPYIEQENVANQYPQGLIGFDVPVTVKTFIAPADPTNNPSSDMTSYGSNIALFQPGARLPASFNPKGTSNTVMLMERYALAAVGPSISPPTRAHKWSTGYTGLNCSAAGVGYSNYPQFAPPPAQADNRAPQGFSPSVMQVCLGDGSVRTITPGITQATWNWACNPTASTPPGPDW